MRITGVDVSVLEVPVERPYRAAGRPVNASWHVLARVATAGGVQGVGYVVSVRPALVRPLAEMARELGQLLVGASVLEVEAARARMERVGSWVGPGGMLNMAMAPLDIAMWDAAGKVMGQPLYRLLGGYRDRVPAYASDGLWTSLSLDELGKSAGNHVARGFRALKLRLGAEDRSEDEASRVRAAREAAGPGVSIMVDATETWDVSRALRTGRHLQEEGISWLEDPVDHQRLGDLAHLATTLEVPIAGGEHLYEIEAFQRTLDSGAVRIAIIDLARIGGITPWRKVAALAEAAHVPVAGHVIPEVHVHLLAAIPNGYVVELVPRSAPILAGMPSLEDGNLVAPTGRAWELSWTRGRWSATGLPEALSPRPGRPRPGPHIPRCRLRTCRRIPDYWRGDSPWVAEAAREKALGSLPSLLSSTMRS